MKISVLTGAVALLALATSANAADLYKQNGSTKDAPSYTAPFDLSGFYVGAQVGGAWSDLSVEGTTKNPSGVAGRGTIGYDATLPNGFLAGLYGEFGAQDGQIAGTSVSQRLEWGGGVKVGHQIGSAVAFTKLGYTGLQFTGNGVNEIIDGFAVTPGIDYPLGGGLSFTGEVKVGFYPEQTIKNAKVSDTVVEPSFGLAYHFGQPSSSLK